MNAALDDILQNIRPGDACGGSHPEFEVLVAFAEGRVSESERTMLLDHIGRCRACGDLVLEMKNEMRDREVNDQAWAKFQNRVAGIDEGIAVPEFDSTDLDSTQQPEPRRTIFKRLSTAYAIAAVLLAALLISNQPQGGRGLASWELTSVTPRHLKPNAGVSVTRGASESVRYAGKGDLVLFLATRKLLEYDRYLLEIKEKDADKTYVRDGLMRQDDGSFIVVFPSGVITTGDYYFKTYGLSRGEWVALDEYEIEIVVP